MSAHVFRIGTIRHDRFWIERPDGRLFQIDGQAKEVLERLASGVSAAAVCEESELEPEELAMLFQILGIGMDESFVLVGDDANKVGVGNESAKDAGARAAHWPSPTQSGETTAPVYVFPWLERRWFAWIAASLFGVAVGLLAWFVYSAPLAFVVGFADQWIVAGALTVAVILHELGHLLAMPRSGGISVTVHWSGPLPMFSIVCNGAWKLSGSQRVRIDLAGFATDVLVCGIAAAIGLVENGLSPWIWTFILVQGFRMLFAIWPLLPGDGYWLLVDLFSAPNLWMHAAADLKRLRINWLSLYALLRILFLLLLWLLYGYMLYFWIVFFLSKTWDAALGYMLYPAPLLMLLNVLSQLYGLAVALWRFSGKKASPRSEEAGALN
ncbi:MAG: hypothetical protein K0Q94_5637 [Paenibacillus sp.]|nr:hypothetical protein [Paenibacillus sp.]